MGGSIVLGLCLFTLAFGMEEANQVDYQNLRKSVEKHLANNQGLLDSSKGRDIVVFLGRTGAGKSTLINYLSGKQLEVDGYGDIILEDPKDPSAMVIGEGSDSETFLPRFISVGDLLLYDLPGFNDTRGTARNLVNACFIKTIIENARSARLVFVAGIGQINEGRAEMLEKLSKQATQLIPNKSIENFSALIITKSNVAKNVLPGFLERKLNLANPNLSIVSHWISHQKIDQVSQPLDGQIDYHNRESILGLIGEIGHEQIEDIHIGAIYDLTQQLEIKAIYEAEIDNIVERLIAQNGCCLDLISGCNPRFIGESPTPDSLKLINLDEIGIYCDGDKLYGKTHDKEAIEIGKPEGDAVAGFSLRSFNRITRTLKDATNIEQFNVALQQKEERRQAIAAFNNNIPYESTTLSDIEALLLFSPLRDYITLDKAILQKKRSYIENELTQCVSLSLDESSLIKLLHPISEDIYQSTWNARKQNLAFHSKGIASLLNEEIAKKEKQEAEQVAAAQTVVAAAATVRATNAEATVAQLQNAGPSNEVRRFCAFVGRGFK